MKKIIALLAPLIIVVLTIAYLKPDKEVKTIIQEEPEVQQVEENLVMNNQEDEKKYNCHKENENGSIGLYKCTFKEFKENIDKKQLITLEKNEEVLKRDDKFNERVHFEAKKEMFIYKEETPEKYILDIIENQELVDKENKWVNLNEHNLIDSTTDVFINEQINTPLPIENSKPKFPNKKYYLENYYIFNFIKPLEFKKLIQSVYRKETNGFDFFYFKDGYNLEKQKFSFCHNENDCYFNNENLKQSHPYKHIHFHSYCTTTYCQGKISSLMHSELFYLSENGELFIYNDRDKNGYIRGDLIKVRYADEIDY